MQIRKWKRHEFSDYLTKTGVSAALADAVLELCRAEERPSDPIEYVKIIVYSIVLCRRLISVFD
jgi:hypothetical protein